MGVRSIAVNDYCSMFYINNRGLVVRRMKKRDKLVPSTVHVQVDGVEVNLRVVALEYILVNRRYPDEDCYVIRNDSGVAVAVGMNVLALWKLRRRRPCFRLDRTRAVYYARIVDLSGQRHHIKCRSAEEAEAMVDELRHKFFDEMLRELDLYKTYWSEDV